MEQNLQPLILSITLTIMTLGLIFAILPPVPGNVIIWAAAAGYGLTLGWADHLGWLTFGLLTLLMVIGVAADVLAGHFGAKVGGASWVAIVMGTILGFILAIVASFIGSPILGCIAGMVGMVAGVFGVEWWRSRDYAQAQQALKGYCAGTTLGLMAKVTTSFMMMVVFVARLFAV